MAGVDRSTIADLGCRLSLLVALSLSLSLSLSLPLAAASPASGEVTAVRSGAVELRWVAAPGRLLLVYDRARPRPAGAPATPLLRIYGDGRVAVHRPEHLLRPGDWELRLGADELAALLRQLAALGVADTDPAELARVRREAEGRAAEKASTGDGRRRVTIVTDLPPARLELHLGGLVAPGKAAAGPGVRRLDWRALQLESRRHPEVELLRDLATAERLLLELYERPDLVPLPPPPLEAALGLAPEVER